MNIRSSRIARYLPLIGSTFLIGAAVFAAMWIRVLNAVGMDDWLEGKFIEYSAASTPNDLDPAVRIVYIDAANNGELPGYNPRVNESESWRTRHAQVLDTLARSGANVVAFDFSFARPSDGFKEDNATFAQAIAEVGSTTDTAVITGFKPGESPNAALEAALPRSAMGRIDIPQMSRHFLSDEDYTTRVLLAEKVVARTPSGDAFESIVQPLPMPLAVYIASQREARGAASVDLHPFSNELEIDWERAPPTTITVEVLQCSAGDSLCIPNDGSSPGGDYTIYQALLPFWIRRPSEDALPYERVFGTSDASELFGGKIVLIGARVDDEVVTLGPGAPNGTVYGYEVQAHVISDLLNSSYPRRLHEVLQFFLLTLTAALGYFARTRLPIKPVNVPWGWLDGHPVPLGLFAVGAALLIVAFLLFRSGYLIFDVGYYAIALAAGYFFVPDIGERASSPAEGRIPADAGGEAEGGADAGEDK